MKFKERLKELRLEKCLSQQELSNKLGMSMNTISKWETGVYVPSVEALITVAKFFNESTDYLLGLID